MNRFDFGPGRILRLLVVLIASMLVVHLASVALIAAQGGIEGLAWWAYTYFNMDSEDSLPTAYSIVMLSLVAIVSAQLAISTRGAQRIGMALIALVFAFLSWDEGATIHERIGYFTQGLVLGDEATIPHTWVLFATPLAILFGIVAIRLLRSLPRGVLIRMVVAGVVFLAGAVGMELVASALFHSGIEGTEPLVLALTGIEELLEMLGVAYFFTVLLGYRATVEEARGIRVVHDLRDVSAGPDGRSYARRRDVAAGDGAPVA